ncbi:MAG: hydrogenase 2 operon protein HybA [Candidatus Marinimicrobia bacterium]|nr:hydrogenase 2 operon protein HybA [Candidatus Neomarinimicrobiota bacterium]MBL6985284.1 hydrogenase 2 operon protein HybA [Candidatus Thioglobus sp.]
MTLNRRDFFKVLSFGAAVATGTNTLFSNTAIRKKFRTKDAVGILYDATLCIGCKACEVACKKVNGLPSDHSDWETKHGLSNAWDSGSDLSTHTLNKIKLYQHGDASVKNRSENGFAFMKRACMHCVDPACVSACPVSGFTKDPVTGIVSWNESCCGCRYCEIACPYSIPRFEYNKAIPEVFKCEMCSHVVEKGGIPGCCESCPSGASIFGNVYEILKEAKRRIALKPGEQYAYPISTVHDTEIQVRSAEKYIHYIYGEKEAGGTQYLILSAIPFEKLGLPKLPETSAAATTETIQHTIYKGLIAPIALLTGLVFAAHRSAGIETPNEIQINDE